MRWAGASLAAAPRWRVAGIPLSCPELPPREPARLRGAARRGGGPSRPDRRPPWRAWMGPLPSRHGGRTLGPVASDCPSRRRRRRHRARAAGTGQQGAAQRRPSAAPPAALRAWDVEAGRGTARGGVRGAGAGGGRDARRRRACLRPKPGSGNAELGAGVWVTSSLRLRSPPPEFPA